MRQRTPFSQAEQERAPVDDCARYLLNHKNYRRVNPFTGDGYKVGDYNPSWDQRYGDFAGEDGGRLTTDSEAYAKGVVNPSYKEDPRMFLWGVSYSW